MKQVVQNRKKTRWLVTMLAAALMAAVIFPAGGKIVRADEACSLEVTGGGESDTADLANADMRIDLYKIADGTKDSSYDTWHWTLTEDFKGLEFDEQTIDNAGYTQLAQEAANIAVEKGLSPVSMNASAGKALFSNLDPGLYVILPRDNRQQDDADIVRNGEDVRSIVNTPDWVYQYSPSITAVPGKEAVGRTDANPAGEAGTAADYGPWINDVKVVLKPAVSERLGSIEIVKTLRTYETKDPATFVFSVEATKADAAGEIKTVYSDVVSITFTGAGQQSRVVEGIPTGAAVTVTEVYSGASYKQVSAQADPVVITAEEVKQVSFTNDYDDTYHGGGGIENQFAYQPSESGTGEPWNFTQVVNGAVEKKIVNGEVVE